jgi:NAD(P)-dependent dehydrogenase (short-subunit alcohol dehydrogenase family)
MSLSGEAFNSLVRSGVGSFVKALAKELETISVHWLTVGLTEEFLLQRYPKSPSIKLALEELRKVLPGIKIQDPSDIANAVAFLSSPLSAAIC